MKRQEADNLNKAISSPDTKFKTGMNIISNPSFVTLMRLKTDLKKYFEAMYEEEMELAGLFKGTISIDQNVFKPEPEADEEKVKDFFGKLLELRKKDFYSDKINFLPIDEFRRTIEDCDNQTSFTLTQHLLKDDAA